MTKYFKQYQLKSNPDNDLPLDVRIITKQDCGKFLKDWEGLFIVASRKPLPIERAKTFNFEESNRSLWVVKKEDFEQFYQEVI